MVRFSVSPMPFVHLPLADELSLGRRLGWPAVVHQGLPITKLRDTGWLAAARLCEAAGTPISYLATGTMIAVDDDHGWADHRRLLSDALRWAADQAVPIVYLTTGPSGTRSPEEATHDFARQVAPLVDLARDLGVTLALENTAWIRSDLGFAHSIRETAEVAAHAGLGLVADLFGGWQEHHLVDTLTEHLDRIAIVQYADFTVGTLFQPARRVPGDGDIPLARLVELVPKLGYTGWVDLELLGPQIEAEGAEQAVTRGLRWLLDQRWD